MNPEITIFYQFHDQKALFKVPKSCNIRKGSYGWLKIKNNFLLGTEKWDGQLKKTLYNVHVLKISRNDYGAP